MATAAGPDATRIESGPLQGLVDPFVAEHATTHPTRRSSQRYSAFDTQLFSQSQTPASPSQAKRALEAHLTETDRRLHEASKLGTALVQQRKDLAERLKEVEARQGEQEIGPELRQKLLEVEKEFNELGRDSARAFLAPKQHGQTGGVLSEVRNPASPTKFSSQATDSPSKVTVPSRKQRNQATNRVHDIELATEISTTLLAQVRQLQGAVAERDESLRKLTQERSQIEVDHQGLTQRLRDLDESEQRYKDENWTLETKTHELMAAAKESAAREQKLQQSLTLATGDKSAAQRELDDIKQAYGKLSEDHAAFRKTHEADLAGMKKSATQADSDRGVLQRRVDELTTQNQELANAVATRLRSEKRESMGELPSDPEDFSLDKSDLEHSPPPSPSKGGARNSMLESETLKSSLSHAHRMIQTLKTNVHREKSEKLELKRMLQESRDELELRRAEGGASSKRAKTKPQQEMSKKQGKIGQLGAGRSSRTDVQIEDGDWEDHEAQSTPGGLVRTVTADANTKLSDYSDVYQTADETEDAYETANEKETESDVFQTGSEHHARHSSEDLTETEGSTMRSNTVRAANPLASREKRASYQSTASTTDGEEAGEAKTPVQSGFGSLRNRFRLSRSARKSRNIDSAEGTPRTSKDSPASFMSNRASKGQSLAAELGDFDNESIGGSVQNTPSRNTTISHHTTPSRSTAIFTAAEPPVPKLPMVDSGVMTEPWEPEPIVVPAPAPEPPAVPEAPPAPQLAMADIQSVETSPQPAEHGDAGVDAKDAAAAGVIGSVFGWAIGKRTSTPQPGDAAPPQVAPVETPDRGQLGKSWSDKQAVEAVVRNDQSVQTLLSSEQLDSLLANDHASNGVAGGAIVPMAKPSSPIREVAPGAKLASTRDAAPAARVVRRPGSASSARSGGGAAASASDVPPLPSDHREAIAAASQTPVMRERGESSMGPPAMPASAYKTAKKPAPMVTDTTPYGPSRSAAGTPTTPRQLYSATRSTRSRRSSVSSFESEIDARFNIRPDGTPVPQGFDAGTDPRMIQAITQTMIGEYLWKYTRKAGRGDMSGKRHRRFFWVHPYTRTLYWSDQDPSTAGRAQLKAKSVAIEAVRVVTDDNPMPPGLHRKSLMIATPGRDIKFTATTGQRHETWFNALSYLLLRTGDAPGAAYGDPSGGLTAEDAAEFHPTMHGNRMSTASRASLSTYNSRPSRLSSRNQSPTRGAGGSVRRIPPPGAVGAPSLAPANAGTATSRLSDASTQNSLGSRLSGYFKQSRVPPGAAGKAVERPGEIYDARVVHDSAEDVRAVMVRQDDEADRLENVRACCDGKHDVGSLNRHRGSRLSGPHRHSHHSHQ